MRLALSGSTWYTALKISTSPFPRTHRRVNFHKSVKTLTVPIYCACRMPNDNNPYVQCNHCKEWYQLDCVNIPETAVQKE